MDPPYLERGAAGRDAAGDPGAGGRGPGHHHRRRDPPRELLQPVRHRAGRRRHRQPGHRAGPQRAPEPGAADRRPDPPAAPGRGGRPGVPARAHRPDGQGDRAGPVHDGPAGAERLLPGYRGGRLRLRRGGERGGARPVRGGRRHRPAGRAVPAGPAGGRPRSTGWRRSTGPWTGSPARPRCISASATRRSSTSARRATRSCPSWPSATADQVSIETAQSGLDCSVLATLDGQDDHPGRAEPGRPGGGDRGAGRWTGPAGRSPTCPPGELVLAPDCGMKYLPRDVGRGKLAALTQAAAQLRSEFGG